MNEERVSEQEVAARHKELIERPEELVFRSCYAPVDLGQYLASAETRSKIRKLPPAQLFFAVMQLPEEEIEALLPHITEEQWTTVLDLDLWNKDRLRIGSFLGWERHLVNALEPVARKIVRATDPELWELAFATDLEILGRTEEDEYEGEAPDGAVLATPDDSFLVVLPDDPEKARLYRKLLLKLYEMDAETAAALLLEAKWRPRSELEEEAYQSRRRRIEDLGFQDYFDAIEIYTPLKVDEEIPRKREAVMDAPSELPEARSWPGGEGLLLFFRAMAGIGEAERLESLVEELFFVCNKLLSADRISPDSPVAVKRGIRKTLSALNLGLASWSRGEVPKAISGLQTHYLVSFFQIGYGELMRLQSRARRIQEEVEVDPGSYLESALESLLEPFPRMVELQEGKIRQKFIDDLDDLKWVHRLLDQIAGET